MFLRPVKARQSALVLNCGSSSVKFSVFKGDEPIVRGSFENIGQVGSGHMSFKSAIDKAIKTALAESKSRGFQIDCVGHRVVHGGSKLIHPSIIDSKILQEIKNCTQLAPLHNPSNLEGIEVASAMLHVPHVACFDTAFHSTIQQRAYQYGIPKNLNLRRYGFHGLSYSYIASIIRDSPRMIVAHLGSGCSAAAIVDGQSVDTTMGFTPMEGLVMSTRSGTIDPGLIFHLLRNEAKVNGPTAAIDDVSDLLNKKSGLLGLSGGLSSDMKTLLDKYHSDSHAALAVDVFVYSVQKHIGQLLASLEYNVDALVFTGGIGENSAEIRKRVTNGMTHLGLKIDQNLNMKPPNTGVISMTNSKIKVYAMKTNEELQIARDAIRTANAS
jgi:acetate kinase